MPNFTSIARGVDERVLHRAVTSCPELRYADRNDFSSRILDGRYDVVVDATVRFQRLF